MSITRDPVLKKRGVALKGDPDSRLHQEWEKDMAQFVRMLEKCGP